MHNMPFENLLNIFHGIDDVGKIALGLTGKFNWGPNPLRETTATNSIDHASAALTHYFFGDGKTVTYSAEDICEMISCSENNLDHLHSNLTWVMKCAEQTLNDGKQIVLATKSDSQMKSACNVDRGSSDGGLSCQEFSVRPFYQILPDSGYTGCTFFNYLNKDWINAVGEAAASVVAVIARSGDRYEMRYRYIVKDIYEWTAHYDEAGNFFDEPHYHLEPTSLHWFHEFGSAEEYLMYGEFEGVLAWTAGQTAFDSDVFETVKQTLKDNVSWKSWLEGNEYERFEADIADTPRTDHDWLVAYNKNQLRYPD